MKKLNQGSYVLVDGKVGRVKALKGFHAEVETVEGEDIDPATIVKIVTVTINVLTLLSDLIPVAETLWAELKRLWLLIFGKEEQKQAVKKYNELRKALKDA